MNPTKAEKDRERRRREEKEKEKQRKEEEEKKKKTKPDTPAVKYGKNLCKYAWRGNVKRCMRCIRKAKKRERFLFVLSHFPLFLQGASVEFAHPISLARPLHRAALGGSLETVTFLVKEHKAMLNACDDEEWRPLHFAASKGHTDICRFLVQNGAEIGAKDAAGNTALHLAAAKGHAETVEALVAMGANPTETNASNKVEKRCSCSKLGFVCFFFFFPFFCFALAVSMQPS